MTWCFACGVPVEDFGPVKTKKVASKRRLLNSADDYVHCAGIIVKIFSVLTEITEAKSAFQSTPKNQL